MEVYTAVPIDRTRFLVGFVVSNVVLVAVLAGMVSAGAGAAIPAAGVGTFSVTFDELQGEEFEQYSSLEHTETCDEHAVNVAQIESGTIEGLHLYQDVEAPVTDDTYRVSIQADDVEFDGLSQQFVHLEGDISFSEDQTAEYDTDGDEDRMRVTAPEVTIQDGQIATDSQFISQLSLDDLEVDVISDPDDDPVESPEVECLAVPEDGAAAGDDGSDADGNVTAGGGDANETDDE